MAKKVLLIAGMLVCGIAAQAQSNGDGYLTIGYSRLSSSSAGNATNDNGFSIGYGWRMNRPGYGGLSSVPAIELSYARHGGSDSLDSVMAMYTERFYQPGQEVYFGLGVGAAYHMINIGSFDTDAFRFAAKALVGYGINEQAFVELAYIYSGSVSGLDTNRFGISVGYRF